MPRCPRPHCGGNLIFYAHDLLDGGAEWRCLLCAHTIYATPLPPPDRRLKRVPPRLLFAGVR